MHTYESGQGGVELGASGLQAPTHSPRGHAAIVEGGRGGGRSFPNVFANPLRYLIVYYVMTIPPFQFQLPITVGAHP